MHAFTRTIRLYQWVPGLLHCHSRAQDHSTGKAGDFHMTPALNGRRELRFIVCTTCRNSLKTLVNALMSFSCDEDFKAENDAKLISRGTPSESYGSIRICSNVCQKCLTNFFSGGNSG